MSRFQKFLIELTLLFSTAFSCYSQVPASPAERIPTYTAAGIFYDQDYTLEMLGLKTLNEDRNYTLGLGIYFSDRSLQHSFLLKPQRWLNCLFGKSFLHSTGSIPAIMIANGSFTPDSLPASYPIRNDRPYASLTYFQTINSYVDHLTFTSYTSSLSVGILGTAISREVQTAIHTKQNDHDTKAPRTPRGWANQISNGGELTLSYAAKKEKLLSRKMINAEQTAASGMEWKHGWQYSLGYYTSLNYEADFRLGRIDPRHWTYMINPLSQSNKAEYRDTSNIPKVIPGYYDKPKTFELYLFGSARPSFILYNALLNGQFRKSEHILSFHDMNHLVFDFDAGVATTIPFHKNNMVELKLKLSGRSPEFKLPGRPPRWHYWGGVEFLISCFRY